MFARICTVSLLAIVSLFEGTAVRAQTLMIEPVSIRMNPSSMSATLTVTNKSSEGMAFQVRGFTWTQHDGHDALAPTDQLLLSPPLGTIPAAASQVVRIVLRKAPEEHESSYRILIDQIPPPAAAGTIRVALRLSVPLFAEPTVQARPILRWGLEQNGDQIELVAKNDGNRHEIVRDISLITPSGTQLRIDSGQLPYVLAGSSQRWRLATKTLSPDVPDSLRLTARGEDAVIEAQINSKF